MRASNPRRLLRTASSLPTTCDNLSSCLASLAIAISSPTMATTRTTATTSRKALKTSFSSSLYSSLFVRPPRLPYLYPRWCLPGATSYLHTSSPACTRKEKKPPSNPWSVAKALAKKTKVRQRAEELQKQRAEAASDPVVGHTTSFLSEMDQKPPSLEPLDNLLRGIVELEARQAELDVIIKEEKLGRLNHYLSSEEVYASIQRSKVLEERPREGRAEDLQRSREEHANATAAMHRILSLSNGSSMDRTRANKQWCIETFGRHMTDLQFPEPRYKSTASNPETDPVKTPRVGADTGSSEVQAAILTIKIRALAKHMETFTQDKSNKRNLRLMVHKRQKLLKYLKKRERGGERYRHVMESLGLDDEAVTKEIFM